MKRAAVITVAFLAAVGILLGAAIHLRRRCRLSVSGHTEIAPDGPFQDVRTAGPLLIAVLYDSIRTWRWDGLSPQQRVDVAGGLGAFLDGGEGPASWVLDGRRKAGEWGLDLLDRETGVRRTLAQLERGYYAEALREAPLASRVGLLAKEDTLITGGRPLFDRIKMGWVDESGDVKWVTTIQRARGNPCINAFAISPDGRYLAVGGANSGGWILLADATRSRDDIEFTPSGSCGFSCLAFSSDSLLLYAGNAGGELYGIDVETGHAVLRWCIEDVSLLADERRIERVAASPDGRLVAVGTGTNGALYILDARRGRLLARHDTGQGSILGLAFGPDSRRIATCGTDRDEIAVWDLRWHNGEQ